MLIDKVRLNNQTLGFNYDDNELIIDLRKKYTKEESFTLYIKHTAQPEKVKQKNNGLENSKPLLSILICLILLRFLKPDHHQFG